MPVDDAGDILAEMRNWPTEPPHSVRVVARLRSPIDIATDGSALYVTDVDINDANDTADIVKIPLPAGRSERLAANQRGAQGLVVEGKDLVWVVSGDIDRQIPDAIFRMPSSGGKPIRVATTFVLLDAALAPRDGAVFFFGPLKGGDGSVTRFPLTPNEKPTRIAAADRDAHREVIAVDAANVYWFENLTIKKAPLGGGPASAVAEAKQVRGMVSDGQHLYWTDMGEGGRHEGFVKRAPTTGGPVEILRRNDTRPWGIAVDDKAVYWVSNDDTNGSVNKLFKHSPPVFGIVSGLRSPVHIVVAGSNVYWTNAGDGTVMTTTK